MKVISISYVYTDTVQKYYLIWLCLMEKSTEFCAFKLILGLTCYMTSQVHMLSLYSSHSLNLMCYGSLISVKKNCLIQASQNILWFLGARCGRDVWQCWFVMIIGWIHIYNYIYIVHKQNHDNNLRVLCYYASKEVSRQGLRIRSEWTACIAKIPILS